MNFGARRARRGHNATKGETMATRHDEHAVLIDGEWRVTDATYEVINPATEEVVGLAPDCSLADANAAIAAAKAAQPTWAAMNVDARCALMLKAAAALSERAGDLVPLVIDETGATARVGASMQVPVAVDRFKRYGKDPRPILQTPLLPNVMATTPLAPGGIISGMVNRLPVGVVACITPYNFPLANMVGKIAPALAVGNTVVVKPAPQDPLAIVELVRILDQVGFPPGVVNLVNARAPEPAAVLVDSKDVDMVSFTGSTLIGSKIFEAGGKTMKRLLLELGGKGACVVFDDATVAAAVGCIGSTWSFHSGQICTAPTRAVVQRKIFDKIRAGLIDYAGRLQVGDPRSMDTIVGPLISGAQRARVEAYIATATKDGGDVVVGGERPNFDSGFYVSPTLVEGSNAMTCAQEEIFGPVVTMIPFDDEEEGIAIANDIEFGLYDYVFSGDGARALRVGQRLQAGHVGINTAQRNHDAPFGGFKMSGIGRDGGDYGLLAYSEMQSLIWSA